MPGNAISEECLKLFVTFKQNFFFALCPLLPRTATALIGYQRKFTIRKLRAGRLPITLKSFRVRLIQQSVRTYTWQIFFPSDKIKTRQRKPTAEETVSGHRRARAFRYRRGKKTR